MNNNKYDAGEILELAEGLDITILEKKAHVAEGQIEYIAKNIEQKRDGQRFAVNWGTWVYKDSVSVRT